MMIKEFPPVLHGAFAHGGLLYCDSYPTRRQVVSRNEPPRSVFVFDPKNNTFVTIAEGAFFERYSARKFAAYGDTVYLLGQPNYMGDVTPVWRVDTGAEMRLTHVLSFVDSYKVESFCGSPAGLHVCGYDKNERVLSHVHIESKDGSYVQTSRKGVAPLSEMECAGEYLYGIENFTVFRLRHGATALEQLSPTRCTEGRNFVVSGDKLYYAIYDAQGKRIVEADLGAKSERLVAADLSVTSFAGLHEGRLYWRASSLVEGEATIRVLDLSNPDAGTRIAFVVSHESSSPVLCDGAFYWFDHFNSPAVSRLMKFDPSAVEFTSLLTSEEYDAADKERYYAAVAEEEDEDGSEDEEDDDDDEDDLDDAR